MIVIKKTKEGMMLPSNCVKVIITPASGSGKDVKILQNIGRSCRFTSK